MKNKKCCLDVILMEAEHDHVETRPRVNAKEIVSKKQQNDLRKYLLTLSTTLPRTHRIRPCRKLQLLNRYAEV